MCKTKNKSLSQNASGSQEILYNFLILSLVCTLLDATKIAVSSGPYIVTIDVNSNEDKERTFKTLFENNQTSEQGSAICCC